MPTPAKKRAAPTLSNEVENRGPKPRSGVRDFFYSTPEEFLSELAPSHTRWQPDPNRWIFRGQANAEWPLAAKAVRAPEEFAKFGIHHPATHWSSRRTALTTMLWEFQSRLDRSGVGVPVSVPTLDVQVLGTRDQHSSVQPPQAAFPLMALAQHSGLPTTMLDWSRRAHVAAYFAAVFGADRDTRGLGDHIAVWAMEAGIGPTWFEREVQIYQAPAGANPNLRAQAGVFTLVHSESDDSLDVVYPGLLPSRGEPKRTLVRLSLPIAHAAKLVRLLSYEGIDGASMFPGADGVAKAMHETRLWDMRNPAAVGASSK